jgi:hypothetical protein
MVSRCQLSVVAVVGLLMAGAWRIASPAAPPLREAGFWFEDVAFASARLGGRLTPSDVATVEAVARLELARAFDGLDVTISSRRTARYQLVVVQELQDLRFRRQVGVAGASRAVPGLGGRGAVSFDFLANGAVANAPSGAGRGAVIEAIGRGVGRAAVHELTHQLLPKAPIHDSTDVGSYEFASAARREQYYGDMHWGFVRPLLEQARR